MRRVKAFIEPEQRYAYVLQANGKWQLCVNATNPSGYVFHAVYSHVSDRLETMAENHEEHGNSMDTNVNDFIPVFDDENLIYTDMDTLEQEIVL